MARSDGWHHRNLSLDRMLRRGGDKNEAYAVGYADLDGSPHGIEPSELAPLYDLLSEQLLPRLSDKHRGVLEALFWERVSARAYGRRIGKSDWTVRAWRNEALTQLRAMLKGELAEHASEAA